MPLRYLARSLARLTWQLAHWRNLRFAARFDHTGGLYTLPWRGPDGEQVAVLVGESGQMCCLPVACRSPLDYLRLQDRAFGEDTSAHARLSVLHRTEQGERLCS